MGQEFKLTEKETDESSRAAEKGCVLRKAGDDSKAKQPTPAKRQMLLAMATGTGGGDKKKIDFTPFCP